jgi:outer membrane protein assembly factor BamB
MNARWLLFGAALGLACLTAAADDWPQWRGPGRDNKVTGFAVPPAWPKALTQKWKTPVGDGVASPVLVGNHLFAFARQGGDEVLHCLDAATGKEVWSDKHAAAAFRGADSKFLGPRSTPAAADGKVCTLGVLGTLSCVDAGTGKVVWRKETKGTPRFHTSVSPVIVDGACVVQVGSEKGGGDVVAFDLANGSEKWKCPTDGTAYSSPVVATIGGVKQVVTMTGQSLVGVSAADGKLLWKTPFQASRYNNTVTPIVSGQAVICAGQGTGTEAVEVTKEGTAFKAKQLWKVKDGPEMYNTPVLKDGLIYGINQSQNFYCLDAKTGKLLWTDDAKRGECGSILDAGPVLLGLGTTSDLVVFKPSKTGYEQLAKYKVADTPTWAVPIVSGNRVYVKDRDSVILWTVE